MRGACSTLTRGAALPCRRSCCRGACGRALTTTRTCSPCGRLWTRRHCCAREAFFARPRSSFRKRARALTGACRRAATAAKTRAGGSCRTAGGWERSRRVVTFDRATGCEYLEGRADTGSTQVQVGERLRIRDFSACAVWAVAVSRETYSQGREGVAHAQLSVSLPTRYLRAQPRHLFCLHSARLSLARRHAHTGRTAHDPRGRVCEFVRLGA